MQIVDYPLLPPGKCVECGYGGRDRKYADTGLDLEFYGVVYICQSCIINWANHFGLGDVSELRESVDRLSARVGELEDERDSILGTLRTLEPSYTTPANQPSLLDTDYDEVKSREGSPNPKFSQLSL